IDATSLSASLVQQAKQHVELVFNHASRRCIKHHADACIHRHARRLTLKKISCGIHKRNHRHLPPVANVVKRARFQTTAKCGDIWNPDEPAWFASADCRSARERMTLMKKLMFAAGAAAMLALAACDGSSEKAGENADSAIEQATQ